MGWRISTAILGLMVPTIAPQAWAQADLVGEWKANTSEDVADPDIGSYEGLPIRPEARKHAETWSASLWTVPEHQCIPHPSDYAPFFNNVRIWKDVDPLTQVVTAYHTNMSWMNATRTIWMDGRPHPGPNTRHTWEGFSTGKWEGDVLTVTTTHLKEGYIKRNGLPRSVRATLIEHFIRVGDTLTWVSRTENKDYLSEPYVKSFTFRLDPGYQNAVYPCSTDVEIDRPEGVIPFYQTINPDQWEYATKHHLPRKAVSGGAETMYPEYQATLPGNAAPALAAAGTSRR